MHTVLIRAMTAVLIFIIHANPSVFAENPPNRDLTFGPRVAEMMAVGYARGPQAFNESRRQYESLCRDSGNDPRIDYAYGLILLRLMKNKDAQEAFVTATTRPGTPYWPAWQALIWTNLVGKDYPTGYEHLLDFAKLVQTSEALTNEARDDSIHWMGHVMAALELTLESKPSREVWLQTEQTLTDLLGDAATEDYRRGVEYVRIRHALLEEDIQQTREKAKKQQAELLEKKQSRIQKSLDAVKEKRENLKKTADEMKELLADHTAAYQKQMTRLEKDFDFLARRSAVLVTSIMALDQEVAILEQRKKNSNGRSVTGIDQAITQIQNQRLVYSTEYLRTTAAADQIAATAQQLSQQRAEFVDQYQKATGELIEEDAGAEKWKERTLNQAKALKKAKENAKPPVPVAKIQAAKTFRTYFDLDLFAERNKVLESFGIMPPDK